MSDQIRKQMVVCRRAVEQIEIQIDTATNALEAAIVILDDLKVKIMAIEEVNTKK